VGGHIYKIQTKKNFKQHPPPKKNAPGSIELGLRRLDARARCAWNWIEQYAPADFRFRLRPENAEPLVVSAAEQRLIQALVKELTANFVTYTEVSLAETIYKLAQEHNTEPKDFFKLAYRVLIGKEMGPRLAGFILTIGRERVLKRLENIRILE
jgi:lysyl-tRNA synthetase class 1